jgi:hypothetical protein
MQNPCCGVLPGKTSAILYNVNYAYKQGQTEGEPDLFVRTCALGYYPPALCILARVCPDSGG